MAEVSIAKEGGLHVERVVCAADCGTLINPDAAAAQMEGGIIFGLSAALHGRITLHHGAVMVRSNSQIGLMVASLSDARMLMRQLGARRIKHGQAGTFRAGGSIGRRLH